MPAEFPFHNLPQAFVEAHMTSTADLVRRSETDRIAYEALAVLARVAVVKLDQNPPMQFVGTSIWKN